MDRRTFLRSATGMALGVALESCGKPTVRGRGAGKCPPASAPASPALRIGDQFGSPIPPLPFSYPAPAYALMGLVFDPMIWTDDQDRLIPWLANGYTKSADGLTYTFDLRDDVTWSDGKKLDVADVVFSYQTLLSLPNPRFVLGGSLIGYKPDNVVAVGSPGNNKVEFRLDKPAVTFLRNVAARIPIAPKHIFESYDSRTSKLAPEELMVGSGPFRVSPGSFIKGKARFVRRDDFFLGKPSVKSIEYVLVGDPLASLDRGDTDAAPIVTSAIAPPSLAHFEKNCDFALLQSVPDSPTQLYFNLAKGGPLADIRFRRAVAMAIDRNDMLRRVTGAKGYPGNPGFLPPGNPFRADVEQYKFDLRAAIRSLDDAGYKKEPKGVRRGLDGKELRFKVLASADVEAVVEIIRLSLKSLGVEIVTVPATGPPDLIIRLSTGDYDLAVASYGGLNQDPDLMRTVYSSRVNAASSIFTGIRRPHGYANVEFDDLADKQLITQDKVQRQQLLARMQEIVAQDLPVLPLIYPASALVYRKKIFQGWDRSGKIQKANLILNRPSPLPE